VVDWEELKPEERVDLAVGMWCLGFGSFYGFVKRLIDGFEGAGLIMLLLVLYGSIAILVGRFLFLARILRSE